jgi:acetyl esterase/lipase
MSFRRRQAITAALTANAIRPVPTQAAGVPSFFAGWLTGELAPQVLALTAADAAVNALSRRHRDPVGLGLAAASAAGLGYLVWQGRSVRDRVEDALTEALGVDYVEQLDAAPTPAELATPWRSLVNPFRIFRAPNEAIHVERDIAFGEAGARNHLDIYLPAERPVSGAPVLLQVHGGGWTIGRKDQQGIPLMQHLAAKGWVCVAINYRLAPRDPFPAQIIDVKRGIAWIRENIAAYGGDPDYIAITGGSAGGHLTALAALTPNDPAWQPGFEDVDTSVQLAIPHYGIYDMGDETDLTNVRLMRDRFLGPRVLKKRFVDEPGAFVAASPISRITPDAPDFFVLHGTHDSLVGVDQARLFVEKLRRESKRTVVYAELPAAQHAFDVFPSVRSVHVVRAIDRYLHWHWNQYRRSAVTSPESARA